jgi:hypothetical protein
MLAYILKEFVWMAIVPIYHFPDEEQHFAETAFWAEKNKFPSEEEQDVNQEIDQSSTILGTKRDGRGMNKFTYHPEYRIIYTSSFIGLQENQISNLNSKEIRQNMVKREAARYGPLYYILSAIPYKIFYQNNLIDRIFASRLISVLLSSVTVLLAYLVGKEIFSGQLLPLSLAVLVSFQPMFSFVSAGVNSDNLFNMLFALILYLCLKIFVSTRDLFKHKLKYWLLLFLSLIGGYFTKPQFLIAGPIITLGVLIYLGKFKKYSPWLLAIFSLGATGLIGWLIKAGVIPVREYDPLAPSHLTMSFLQYIYWHLRHTVAETIPWYWGVFNWLGVVLPRWVYRVQARLLILAGLGIIVYFGQVLFKKKLLSNQSTKVFFLSLAAAIYYFVVIGWDYFFRLSSGFSFGIQGRYFFPTIISHMLIIMVGLISLIPQKFKMIGLKLLMLWWLVFSFIGLLTATKAYYDTWPPLNFLFQASQYKPYLLKGYTIPALAMLYIALTLIFVLIFIRTNEKDIK